MGDAEMLFDLGALSVPIEGDRESLVAPHVTPAIGESRADGESPSLPSLSLPIGQIVEGDSVVRVKELPASSVHMILSDIPYGIGAEDWDVLHDNTNSAYMGSSPAQEKAG